MPPTTTHQATANSFLGLQSYTEAQSHLFFGRDTETDTLTSLIELNTLTIVFGRSGTGKTSLLNAGVFPRLRKSFCLPFRIRLEFNDNSPDLITQVKNVLKQEIDKYGFKVESYPAQETLWEYFHKEPLWKTVTPILVFDQFEEIFTLAKSNLRFASGELPLFWVELADLIENNIPEKLKPKFLEQKEKVDYNYKKQKTKIVFSFREEYLPEFESIASKIPSLKYSRFRLLPMNGNQAYEVITKTWRENINPSEARQIVSYFTNDQDLDDYKLITVEPSLLSQVCAYIDKERIDSGSAQVSAELLNKYPKEAILRSIYEEAVSEANRSLNRNEKNNANLIKEFAEEKLITTEGYRTKYHLGAGDEMLRPGINVLSAKYFVREDDNVVELTHDVLAPIIKIDREKRRKRLADRKILRKAILFIALPVLLIAAGLWLLAEFRRQKAVSEQVLAFSKRDSARLEESRLKDSIRHHSIIVDSLKRIENGGNGRFIDREKIVIIKGDTIRINGADTTGMSQIIEERLNVLVKEWDKAHKVEINGLRNQLDEKIDEISRLKARLGNTPIPPAPDTAFQAENRRLKQELENARSEYQNLKKEYEVLLKERNTWKKEIDRLQKTIDSLRNLTGTISLKGKLYYYETGEKLVKPTSIPIYLISKKHNKRIVKNASVYEINCYEKELMEAKASFKTVTDLNGDYSFRNIPQGEYLLKVCAYYGGFYNVVITDTKQTLTKDLNASPPVRYPYNN